MRHDDFAQFVLDRHDYQRETMTRKNDEYAPGDDKLDNFKEGARMSGETPELVLWMYMMKHLVSIEAIIKGKANYTPELLKEKAGDVSCYLILLEALMQERHT